jgi:hypothetical protein
MKFVTGLVAAAMTISLSASAGPFDRLQVPNHGTRAVVADAAVLQTSTLTHLASEQTAAIRSLHTRIHELETRIAGLEH